MTKPVEINRAFAPRRILIIQYRQIGDALMCTPAIRALRKNLPESRIDFLAEAPAAKALARNPYLSNLVISEPREGLAGQLSLMSRLRGNRYDVVIDYLHNPATAIMSRLTGANYTISYAGKTRSRLYTHAVTPTGDYSAAHKMSLLRPLGIEDADLRPDFFVSDEAHRKITEWLSKVGLSSGGKFVVIDPTHRRVTRRYTRYGELAKLIGDRLGLRCVFVWGPGEEGDVRSIVERAGDKHILAPRTDLNELGALISRAALLVGNDSAPRHIAAALDVPTLTVTGSTRPENWTMPLPIHRAIFFDIECRPCSKNECPRDDVACMTSLAPDRVLDEVRGLLS